MDISESDLKIIWIPRFHKVAKTWMGKDHEVERVNKF
jgi:hypothetical protein